MRSVLVMLALLALLVMPAVLGDRYTVASMRYESARDRFAQLQITTQCLECQEEYARVAGNYLATAADLLHQHLVRLDAYAKASGDQALYAQVHEEIVMLDAEVNATRAKTASLSGASTPAELQDAERAVRASWMRVDRLTRDVTDRVIDNNIELSITKLNETQQKLRETRNSLASQGKDTEELDLLLAKLSRSLEQARFAHEAQGTEGQVMLDASDARERILEAVATLHEITREMRRLQSAR